jgi:putative peptidoglycan lipid II flippase
MIALPIAEQLQAWVERFLASSSEGTLAALDYARTMTDTTLYFVSQPIGLALMASTGEMNRQAVQRRIAAISRPLLVLAMPSSVYLMMFAPDIVQLVLARGAFGVEGVLLTSGALVGIGTGLWATTLGLILIRQLNGENRNGHAALVLVMAYAANIGFNFLASQGALGFGLGESLRGVIILVGAALAVGCGKIIIRLIIQVLPSCCVLWFMCVEIHEGTNTCFVRLIVGAAAYAVVVGITGIILLGDACRWLGLKARAW